MCGRSTEVILKQYTGTPRVSNESDFILMRSTNLGRFQLIALALMLAACWHSRASSSAHLLLMLTFNRPTISPC
jgi:hypothetical protein